ncbi:MAG: pantetheine-phosphate adenylyltransferase [Candidatus Lokiarchaeota archaeon]|nr:pantetheine-phosphate adenylyltransferase [Candidatus Lokiarchaeota archaeon]
MSKGVPKILNKIGMGGTFDHLHDGHKSLIMIALSLSEKVVIGLTSDKLLTKKKFRSKIENYQKRLECLKSYISETTDLSRVEIIKLEDPYGPPIHEAEYEGIIVSQETYEGALKINQIREEKGYKPLIIVVIPLILDNNKKKISSTSIRAALQ